MNIRETMRVSRLIVAITIFVLVLFAIYFVVPLYVMLVNSFKPLSEIRAGNMLAFPEKFSFDFWIKAWSTAQIGVQATGMRPYFLNSVKMVVPAVVFSTFLGALSGFVLAKWRFKGDTILFGLILFGCFIPFQIVLIPTARVLGMFKLAGTTTGLILVHIVYGIGFYHPLFPQRLFQSSGRNYSICPG